MIGLETDRQATDGQIHDFKSQIRDFKSRMCASVAIRFASRIPAGAEVNAGKFADEVKTTTGTAQCHARFKYLIFAVRAVR
jgi:hypothetical protein